MPTSQGYYAYGDRETPGSRRAKADESRRGAPPPWLEEYFGMNFSGKMKPELEQMFMDIFGDGSYHAGGVGGVDRKLDNGVMNEYMGMGDYGALGGRGSAMGEQMKRGNNEVSKAGGFAPSSIYNMDPNYEKYMNKTVRWDQDPNLWNMFMHPYDAERWGDYLPGSDRERGRLSDRNRHRAGGAGHVEPGRYGRHTRR